METNEISAEQLFRWFPIMLSNDFTLEIPISITEKDVELCKSEKIGEKIELMVFHKIENIFSKQLAEHFREFEKSSPITTDGENDIFEQSVDFISNIFERALRIADETHDRLRLGTLLTVYRTECRETALVAVLKGIFFQNLTDRYLSAVLQFYRSFINKYDAFIVGDSCFCKQLTDCKCRAILDCYKTINRKTHELRIIEFLIEPAINLVIKCYISEYVKSKCSNRFDVSLLDHCKKWSRKIVNWLADILRLPHEDQLMVTDDHCNETKTLNKYEQNLMSFMNDEYTKIRIDEIFNIIIEYPDSLAAIQDLASSLPKSNMKPALIETLKSEVDKRLLHQGVSTHDILTAYIATIRTLKIIDPTGILVYEIIQPIHSYLRTREDTIRCIVGSLTEDGPNDLADELIKGDYLVLDESQSDEEPKNWEQWTPQPCYIDEKVSKYSQNMDIVSMLVNVYGSKELFANEYRSLLADRLLSNKACDTDKEIKYLELLKLRFGESPLHFCEVMLKDVSESRRIDNNIRNDVAYREASKTFPLSALIVSAQFWPQFKEDALELPEMFKKEFDCYTKAFEKLKGKRTLVWKPILGSVDIEVEIKNQTYSFKVSPIHAILLMQFEQKERWLLSDLSKVIKMPQALLKKKILFWQYRGLIREVENDVFVIDEDQIEKQKFQTSSMICDEDNDEDQESHMKSTCEKREQELQMFWSYIVGMLTNLDSLQIDRIHQMLKMFASTGSVITDFNIQELRQFLDKKVEERLLEYHNDSYSLAKN